MMRTTSLFVATLLASTAPLLAQTNPAPTPQTAPTMQPAPQKPAAAGNADADMRKVLDAHRALDPKPIEKLSAAEARKQPTLTDAVKRVVKDENVTAKPRQGLQVRDRKIPGAAGQLDARIYTPDDGPKQKPVIVYYHGGGWVIADIDVYEASAAALARKTGAVVLAVAYRQAPENKLPAAHEDAFAAYRWAVENAASIGGMPGEVAVAGESAGGNLAVNVAIMARDRKVDLPAHQLVIYPVASADTQSPSYDEHADAKPLNKATMTWFFEQTLPKDKTQAAQARKLVDLVNADLKGLPSVTLITAEIDPLRSEGEELAEKLKAAGVRVNHRNFEGVTHEFFGADAVVGKAKEAQDFAAQELKQAFSAELPTGSVPEKPRSGMQDGAPARKDGPRPPSAPQRP